MAQADTLGIEENHHLPGHPLPMQPEGLVPLKKSIKKKKTFEKALIPLPPTRSVCFFYANLKVVQSGL